MGLQAVVRESNRNLEGSLRELLERFAVETTKISQVDTKLRLPVDSEVVDYNSVVCKELILH